VRVGKRRVRVRQSQLEAFLAAGEMSQEAEPTTVADPEEDRQRQLREAASALAAAVQAEDQDALEQALSVLTSAARRL
jgi:hypothetical protein